MSSVNIGQRIMSKEHLAPWVEGFDNKSDVDSVSQNLTYSTDEKEAALKSLENFCRELDNRLVWFTNRDPSMLKIFEGDVNLQAEMIGQKVHSFIGRQLIEPTTNAFNYKYISEPRRSAPEIKQGRKKIHPDFRLIPEKWSGEVPPDIIGEIKLPGGSQKGVKQLRTKYLSKIEPPAYGIVTDGVVWHGLVKTEDGISRLTPGQVPTKQLLHRIRRGIVHDRAKYNLTQLESNSQLNRLVSLFEQI